MIQIEKEIEKHRWKQIKKDGQIGKEIDGEKDRKDTEKEL